MNALGKNRIIRTFIVALLLLAAAYLGRGLYLLVWVDGTGKDLRWNWLEFRHVMSRGSPYDFQNNQMGIAADWGSPYPPWTFLLNFVLYWPTWPAARWYFAGLNCVLLGYICWWSSKHLTAGSADVRWLAAATVLAFGSVCNGLGNGQNSIFCVSLLCAAVDAYEARRLSLGGLLLGAALFKPQIAGLFALPFLLRGQWRVTGCAILYVLAATLALVLWCHASPVELVAGWIRGSRVQSGTAGFTSLFVRLGLPSATVTVLAAALFALLAVGACLVLRRRSIVYNLAVCASLGALWTYHRNYDYVMLVFATTILLSDAVQENSPKTWLLWSLCCLSLWVPAGVRDATPGFIVGSYFLWFTVACWLVLRGWKGQAHEVQSANLAIEG
jgi:hypothetical protein